MAYRKLQKVEGYTRKQVVSYMRMRLRLDWRWTRQAILRLYEFQTETEKNSGASVETNGMGFSSMDAPLLSHVACKLRCNKKFTKEEQRELQRIVRRYATQIVEVSDMDTLKIALDRYYIIVQKEELEAHNYEDG